MLNQLDRDELAIKISECAFYYSKIDLDRDKIILTINIIDKFFNKPIFEIIRAYDLYMQDSKNKFFPAPAHLREYLQNSTSADYEAKIIASKILESVKKFGWNNPEKVREYVGVNGWNAIESWGGWLYICENLGSEISITTFNAQTRDMIKANLNINKFENYNENQIELKDETKQLNSFGGLIKDLTKI